MTVVEKECHECGLIYDGEVLNFVEGEKDGLLDNYCPNCGSENIDDLKRGPPMTRLLSDGGQNTPERVPFGDEPSHGIWWDLRAVESCCGCGVGRGKVHEKGCEFEQCPECGGQVIQCSHFTEVLR